MTPGPRAPIPSPRPSPGPPCPPRATVPVELGPRQTLFFRLPDSAVPLVVETVGLPRGADPILRLRDARGRLLAQDDDGRREPLASRLAVMPGQGAPQVLEIRTLDGQPAAFEIALSLRPAPPAGTHWTFEQAASGAPATLPLRMTLESGAAVVLRLPDQRADATAVARARGPRTDPTLALLGPDGRTIAQDDDGMGRLDADVDLPAALPAPLYLRVFMLSGGDVSVALEPPSPHRKADRARALAGGGHGRRPPAPHDAPVRLRLPSRRTAFFQLHAGDWIAQTRRIEAGTDTILQLLAPTGAG